MPIKGTSTGAGDAENLQYSNWIRMQIGDFLKETELPLSAVDELKAWVAEVASKLGALTFSDVTPKKEFSCEPEIVGEIDFVGGDSSGPVEVELLLPIPDGALHKRDYLNCGFLDKRERVLSEIRRRLYPDAETESWSDRYPVLILSPGRPGLNGRIVVDVVLPPGFVTLSRFLPERSNLRLSWFRDHSCPEKLKAHLKLLDDGIDEVPSPFTNGLLARGLTRSTSHALCFKVFSVENVNLRGAYRLLATWLRRRRFLGRRDGVPKLFVGLLLVYLCQKRRVHRDMSSYQIVRNAWSFLGAGGLRESGGIALDTDENGLPASVESFAPHFPVVFLDSSGVYNVAQFVSAQLLTLVEREAEHALRVLESRADDAFYSLFVEDVDYYRRFDYIFRLAEPPLTSVSHWEGAWKYLVDVGCGDLGALACFANIVIPTLTRALGERASFVGNLQCRALGKRLIGVILNPESYGTAPMFEKGPNVDSAESADFRTLWGDERAQARLMGDGSVVEVVAWTPDDCARPGGLVAKIVDHILGLHFVQTPCETEKKNPVKPKSVVELVADFEPVVRGGRARGASMCATGDALVKEIMGLKNSVLAVTGVQGVSPVFGRMDPCPPRRVPAGPWEPVGEEKVAKRRRMELAAASRLFCPEHVGTADMCLRLETSGKWPTDVEAIRRTKTVLLGELGKSLRQTYHLSTALTSESLKVVKNDFVFSLFLGVERELTLMELERNGAGVLRTRSTPGSEKLRREIVHRPILMSHLSGLSAAHPGWSDGARLILRWVRSQMLTPAMVSDEVVALLAASVFLSARSIPTPCRETAVLAAFWAFIAKADFVATPVVVDFGKVVPLESVNVVKAGFVDRRKELPAIVIVTPFDLSGCEWTRSGPSWPVLHHLKKLCKVALDLFEAGCCCDSFMSRNFFEPSTEFFDAVIRLRPVAVPRSVDQVDFSRVSRDDDPTVPRKRWKGQAAVPVLNFDPAREYLAELEAHFGDAALFFADVYGGTCVGIVWKNLKDDAELAKRLVVRGLMDAVTGSKLGLLAAAKALASDMVLSIWERSNVDGTLMDVSDRL